ncbi:MAG: DUF2628 domain-containing protein [Pseudolabrys sp.]|nr:DUF2628 domain-containing protein [Pseudolabrys sp.]
MPSFTVHAPKPRKDETAADPERFAFVRDGFHFWAFVFGPLWLLRYRLWLALIIFVVLYVALEVGLTWIRAPSSVHFSVTLLVGLLMGFEASSIRRWTLTRRGWTPLGFVVAENQEMAERRFFTAWSERANVVAATTSPPPPSYATPVRRGPPAGSDVIGLFPEPGGSR